MEDTHSRHFPFGLDTEIGSRVPCVSMARTNSLASLCRDKMNNRQIWPQSSINGGKRKRKDSATPKSLFFFVCLLAPEKIQIESDSFKKQNQKKTSFSKSIRVETATPRRGWDFVIESIGLTYLSIGCVIIYIYIY